MPQQPSSELSPELRIVFQRRFPAGVGVPVRGYTGLMMSRTTPLIETNANELMLNHARREGDLS